MSREGPMCSNCYAKEARACGECMTCYMWRRRHNGEPRPVERTSRQPHLNAKNFARSP